MRVRIPLGAPNFYVMNEPYDDDLFETEPCFDKEQVLEESVKRFISDPELDGFISQNFWDLI